ncbi:381_t:CDS:2, partial [Ambispora leptoticha]
MLVSKHWSANAVRYLWLQPFHSNLSKTAQQSLINTYLKCLTNDQRDELKFSGIKFPLSKFPKTHRSTTYAYSAFLKHLNFYKLVAFVGAREQELEADHYDQMSKIRVVLRTMLRLFVEYGATIQSLIISTRVGPYPVQDHDDALATPEAKTLLRNIKKLKIEATKYMFAEIFGSLATISCNVRDLDIEWSDMFRYQNVSEIKANWNKLLSAPKNLDHFRLYNSERSDIIGPALVHQQHALRTVNLEKVDFESSEPLIELASCKNLTTLQFKDCTHVTSELIEPMIKAKLSHLRHIDLSGNNECQELLDWAKK